MLAIVDEGRLHLARANTAATCQSCARRLGHTFSITNLYLQYSWGRVHRLPLGPPTCRFLATRSALPTSRHFKFPLCLPFANWATHAATCYFLATRSVHVQYHQHPAAFVPISVLGAAFAIPHLNHPGHAATRHFLESRSPLTPAHPPIQLCLVVIDVAMCVVGFAQQKSSSV